MRKMNQMKRTKRIFTGLILSVIGILFITLNSCKDDVVCAYPDLTGGDISGNVLLFDDLKNPMDRSGMVVSIVGTIPLIFDTTDADGNFTLEDIDFGNYSLSYAKEGYGTYLADVAHNNDDCELVTNMPQFYLGQRSTTSVLTLSAQNIAAHVEIDLTISPAGTTEIPRYVRLFFKNQSDVSSSSYDFESGSLIVESNALNVNLSIGEFGQMGFISGDLIYVKAYGDSYYSNDYYNFLQERFVFPNTNIISPPNGEFIVP